MFTHHGLLWLLIINALHVIIHVYFLAIPAHMSHTFVYVASIGFVVVACCGLDDHERIKRVV